MRRRRSTVILILALVVLVPIGHKIPAAQTVHAAGGSGTTHDDSDNETIVRRNGAACGVERWLVKTGMDPDVRKVDTRHVVTTTIGQLRGMRAPTTLPGRTRVRPAETSVYAIDGTLVRYKEETDSDVHIVIADAAGKTMIVEIPDAADCVMGVALSVARCCTSAPRSMPVFIPTNARGNALACTFVSQASGSSTSCTVNRGWPPMGSSCIRC